jgi:hypothetical protein
MHTSPSFVHLVWITVALLVAVGNGLGAQEPESRAAEIAVAQEEKAGALSPPKVGFVERQLLAIERAGGFGVARGLFVTFGGIKRGSGASIGPAYAKTFTSGALLQARTVYSIRNAKVAQVSLLSPRVAGRRLIFGTLVRWQDVPKVRFHGIAPGVPGRGATYAETQTEVSATAAFRPVRLLRFGAGVGYERFETAVPSTLNPALLGLFVGVPGVNANPRYVHTHGSAAIDSRESEGYTRHGSLLRATLHDYRQQNTGPFSFRRLDGVAEQYVPILRGNWVIYLGVRASTTMTDSGQVVPFFLQPDLGGHDLRGFDNYRFIDRHSIEATVEYRWYAQEFLDAAIFYDAGKAVPRRADLDFTGLNRDYGAGIRLHGPRTTVLRIEVARSRERTRLIFAFSPVGG